MADPSYIVDNVLLDGEAWVGIAHETLSLPAATVTWLSTNDGQTGDFSQYMDLVIIQYAKGASTGTYSKLNFNNDTTSNYAYQYLQGTRSGTEAAGSGTTDYFDGAWYANSSTANVFGASITRLFDINSGKYKSGITQVADDHDGSGNVAINTVTWKSQAPISEIDIVDSAGANFIAGCTFDLFGVLPRMVTA